MSLVLVDAGGTNIGSVRQALARLGFSAHLSSDPSEIASADHVILPGVGAAGPGMQRLHDSGLVSLVRQLKQPVLGVCLGMQLLFGSSEENGAVCLGVIPGAVERLPGGPGLRVPHMGWNRLQKLRDDPLVAGLEDGAHAYFVHSYAAPVTGDTVASSRHGPEFSAVVRRGNFCGMQFHPEKSAGTGSRLLANFLSL